MTLHPFLEHEHLNTPIGISLKEGREGAVFKDGAELNRVRKE